MRKLDLLGLWKINLSLKMNVVRLWGLKVMFTVRDRDIKINQLALPLLFSLSIWGGSIGAAKANQPAGDQAQERIIQSLYGAGSSALSLASAQANLAVEAVLLASRINGGRSLVTTGTLTQFAPASQSFNYSPVPQDRLRVVLIQGGTFEFEFTDLRGELASGSAQFFNRDHALNFKAVQENTFNIVISTTQWNGQRLGHIGGRAVLDNTAYTVDLNLSGNYYFEVDSTGSEYRTEYVLSGGIDTSAMNIKVNEARNFRMITSRNVSTINASTSVNSSASTAEGHQYQFSDGLIRKAFRDGRPSEADYWVGRGSLLKDGNVIGGIQLGYQTERAVFWLVLSDTRDKLELESWQLWDPGRNPRIF